MTSHHKRSLLLAVAAVIICIILTVTASTYIKNLNHMMQDENYRFLEDIARQSAATIDKKLDGDLRMLNGMAIVLGNQDTIDIDHWVDIFDGQELFSELQRIGIIMPDGKGYGQDVHGTDFSDREYFKQAMEGRSVISNALLDKTTGALSFTYAVPICKNNQIAAVMAATANLDVFRENLIQKPFMNQGFTYLVNSSGDVILASSDSSAPAFCNIPDEISGSSTDKNRLTRNLGNGHSGSLEFQYKSKPYFLSYVPLGINQWFVVSLLPSQVVEEKSHNILTLTAIACAVVCILLLAYIFSIFYIQTRSRKKLYQLAYFDELTGLYNKYGFLKFAPDLLKTSSSYAYCVLDVKRFKTINDRFGYSCGDQFLRYIADVLKKSCSGSEIVSRFSADTFHMLLLCDTPEAFGSRLMSLAESIDQYVFSGDAEYHIHLGFGIYRIGKKAVSLDFMGDMAKLALDQCRQLHATTVRFYDEALRLQQTTMQEIEHDMQLALKNREFHMYMQPKYTVSTGKIASAESLVRWIHPQKGLVSPAVFIPVFEKNGFISELDIYMFDELCRILKNWIAHGITPLPISINQSRMNLFTEGYLDKLAGILHKYEVSPSYIIIEITESAFFNDMEAIDLLVSKLHNLGFLVSMDDFGSGYSSLNMLQDVFLDELKIDKNFFNLSANLERGRKIVRNIINMAQDLKISVVAEGVETEEQVLFLKQAGCQMIQGYYYSKPVPYKEFEQMAYEISVDENT